VCISSWTESREEFGRDVLGDPRRGVDAAVEKSFPSIFTSNPYNKKDIGY
jgi:hypothetical protein